MPISSLNSLINLQNSVPFFCQFGVGSTLDGAYKALLNAQQNGKKIETYVPHKTEGMISKSDENDVKSDLVQQPDLSSQEANSFLLAELQAKAHSIDPDHFAGLIQEFQQVLQNFKLNLPGIEAMQLTNPQAYQAILNVVMSTSNLAQSLLESGILNSDLANVYKQQEEAEAQQQQEQEAPPEEAGPPSDQEPAAEKDEKVAEAEPPAKKKASTQFPVGTVKLSGLTYRIKTIDENGNPTWRYASKGLSSGPGGVPVPGAKAGTAKEGIEDPAGAVVTEDEL
jgi:hypothetical protein